MLSPITRHLCTTSPICLIRRAIRVSSGVRSEGARPSSLDDGADGDDEADFDDEDDDDYDDDCGDAAREGVVAVRVGVAAPAAEEGGHFWNWGGRMLGGWLVGVFGGFLVEEVGRALVTS